MAWFDFALLEVGGLTYVPVLRTVLLVRKPVTGCPWQVRTKRKFLSSTSVLRRPTYYWLKGCESPFIDTMVLYVVHVDLHVQLGSLPVLNVE